MSHVQGTGSGLRVVVADNEPFTVSLVAGGLKAQGYTVFTASTIDDAWALIEEHDPHALVSDLDFGNNQSGAVLLSRVHKEYPWVGLVVLTSHRSPLLAVTDANGIPSTAVYLVKSALRRVEDLAEAVQKAIGGQTHSLVRDESDTDDSTIRITAAQAEVLRMLAGGASTKALAEHRGTTVRAAETMLARLYTALGVENDTLSNPRVAAVQLWQQGRISVR